MTSAEFSVPWVRLGAVARIQTGFALDSGRALEGLTVTRPYLRVANVQDGRVDLTEMKEVQVPALSARRYELVSGDVLMTEGGDPDKLGRGTVWEGQIDGCLHQNHVFAVRPTEVLLPRYLSFVTQAHFARDYFEATASKTTGIASTSVSKISSFRIPLPPVGIQQQQVELIENKVAGIDVTLAKKRRLVALMQEYATAAIAADFGSEVKFSALGVPELVGDQPMVRVGAVAYIQSGLTIDDRRELNDFAVSHPYLRVANVQDGRVDLDEVKEVRVPPELAARCALKDGDVLMTEGGDPDKLGRGTVWRDEIPGCLHQNHVFAVRPAEELLPDFLALVTRTPYARAYFEMTASKTTGIASTSTTKIASFRIPLPRLDEQRRIVFRAQSRLARIDGMISAIERQIEKIQEHRQSLITAAVTGELDVEARMAG